MLYCRSSGDESQKFENLLIDESIARKEEYIVPDEIINGEIDILFSHPESLLSHKEERFWSQKFTRRMNVVGWVVEAHGIDLWWAHYFSMDVI